jgi:exodeoxyribonuclease-3
VFLSPWLYTPSVRIVSWNVNGIRAVEKKGFVSWLEAESPDLLCLQETKARPDQLSEELLHPCFGKGKKYRSYWSSAQKAGYSGVAVYSKTEPDRVETLGLPEFDNEGRVLELFFGDLAVISAYFPNSQDAGARLDYKLAFCDAIKKHCDALGAAKKHLVLCGDYNIAHTPIDLARPRENEGNAGYLPEERAWMDLFTSSGYADTFRRLHPGQGGHYSWWSYRMNARERNVVWRIDYHCVDEALMDRVKKSFIRSEVQGSDHCPVELVLSKTPKGDAHAN